MSGNNPQAKLPGWIEYGLLPILNVLLALFVSGLVILIAGANPIQALQTMIADAFGDGYGIGYTLYYTTDMIFAGIAVAMAFHCGLFNIGVEGQAYVAGLGIALVCLPLDHLPFWVVMPLAILASALFGAVWAAIPGWLQARRGSHVVITTIMFNFIASALMNYLLVNVLIAPKQMSPETRAFSASARLPAFNDHLAWLGLDFTNTPFNVAFLLACLALVIAWLYIWHTRSGYVMRVVGASQPAAVYAGIDPAKQIIKSMLLSGALASGIALNEVLGAQGKLDIDFTGGYGFTGIAVALMGRNHPLGIFFAAILFGALYQGGGELNMDMPNISPHVVTMIQGLVILFTGALGIMLRPAVAWLTIRRNGLKIAS